MASSDRNDRRLIVFGVTALIVGTTLAWGLYLIRGVLLLVYVSAILAIGFTPAVNWFEHRRVRWLRLHVSRGAAILIFYVLSVLAVVAIGGVILPPLVRQTQEFWVALPGYLDRAQLVLVARGWLHENWTWSELASRIPSPALAVTSLVGAFESAIGALAALATILVLPYYLLVEADDIEQGLLQLVAPDRRERVGRVTQNVATKVGAWLGSQMLLCAIIGSMASISLWIVGVPYFYVLGLIAGLGELVPVVGPLMAMVPAVLTGCSISIKVGVIVAAYFGLQQIVENYVLIPRIMQRHVGVSAVTVIVALLIGTELLGVVGALLAVPTSAIVQVLFHDTRIERIETGDSLTTSVRITWRVATLAYVAITIVMTWPIAAHLTTEIASDMGDPVFNCWVLSWTGGQVLQALHGHLGALASYWTGNIFYPATHTIAFSEHLTPEMLQILPVYAVTGNIVLCYNLLFLSTFALSGLAMFLFVRDLTGRAGAAFLAGLAFAFAPYRLTQLSHVQVLSSFWMPLALLGLRRYFATRRARAIAGAAAAIVLQALSCGYDLFFFTPFAAAYAVYEVAARGLFGDWRVWRTLALAGLAAVVVILPFALPYQAVRRDVGVGARTLAEVTTFSADTHSFATAPEASAIWGERLTGFPKNEAAAFPGFAILAFAAMGAVATLVRSARQARLAQPLGRWQWLGTGTIGVVAATLATSTIALLVKGPLVLPFTGSAVTRDINPLLAALALVGLAAVMLLPGARAIARGAGRSVGGFFVGAALVAAWLALGPSIEVAGQSIGAGPYAWLFAHAPGFDGLRVPARFLMIVALCLAVLAGCGAAAIRRWWPRGGRAAIALGSIVILAEAWAVPMPYTVRMAPPGFELTARHLDVGREISPLYTTIRDLGGPVVLIEFPFGEPAYDILAEFYAGEHRRPIVNGFSGFSPPRYADLVADLGHDPADRDAAAATRALATTGATHAIVHEGAFTGDRGANVSAWLLSTGARLVAARGRDKLFVLR